MCLLGQATYCPKGFDDVQVTTGLAKTVDAVNQ